MNITSAAPPPALSTTVEVLLHRLLISCSHAKLIYETHGFILRKGLDHNNHLLDSFIKACSALGLSDYAYATFNHRRRTNQPDIYLYNSMIRALARHSHSAKHAILLYNDIQLAAGLRPDTYSIPFALAAAVRLSAVVGVGGGIHCQAIQTGLDSDVHVCNALIQMYASCGNLADARKVFDAMLVRDVASWNAIVSGYSKAGDVDTAHDLFDRMPERNVISWTSVISGYSQAGRPNEAIAIFRMMMQDEEEEEGVELDEVALLCVLSACASVGDLELGEWISNYYIEQHRLHKTMAISNALLDMYMKSGYVSKALQIFENMKHKNVVTWTIVISGLVVHHHGYSGREEADPLEMLSRMERAGVQPNGITFIAVLTACSHAGLVELGRWFFNSMESRYGVKPTIEHYGCLIDLLGRSGCLKEAQELATRRMPFEANKAIWGSLLGASRMHGDVELAEVCLKHLMMMEPNNSGNYTISTNVYASLGRWKECGMMRKAMQDAPGVTKLRGESTIQVNGRVLGFSAGDISSYPQTERILLQMVEHTTIKRNKGQQHAQGASEEAA